MSICFVFLFLLHTEKLNSHHIFPESTVRPSGYWKHHQKSSHQAGLQMRLSIHQESQPVIPSRPLFHVRKNVVLKFMAFLLTCYHLYLSQNWACSLTIDDKDIGEKSSRFMCVLLWRGSPNDFVVQIRGVAPNPDGLLNLDFYSALQSENIIWHRLTLLL